MPLDIPLFKTVQRPLLPIFGSWVDASPFVIFFLLLLFAHLCLHRFRKPKTLRLLRLGCQLTASYIFILFLHRCLCMIRGWIFALKLVGKNDVIAFGHLCMFALLVAVTLAAGRLFCGWLCPLGFMAEILSGIARRRARLPRFRRLLSGYLLLGGSWVLVFWLAFLFRPETQFFSENVAAMWAAFLLVYLVIALPIEKRDRNLKRMKYASVIFWLLLSIIGVFVTSPWCTLFGDEVDYSSAVALLAILLASAILSMAWCRYLCPMGAALGWLVSFTPIRLTNRTPCSGCGACEDLCPMGALENGVIDHSSCIYCGRCIGTCGFAWEDIRTQKSSEKSKRLPLWLLLPLGILGYTQPAAAAAPPATEKAGAGEWLTFHHDNQRRGVAPIEMKTPPFRRRWTFDLGGHTWKYCEGASVWSACALLADCDGNLRVFVGAYDHNVYCLNAENGNEIWRFTTGCLVKAAPVLARVDGRTMLFVASSDRTFYALDALTGRKIWSFETYPWTYTVGESLAGSPLVAPLDSRPVLFGTMWNGDRRPLRTTQVGEVFALEAASGKQLWRRKLSAAKLSPPTFGMIDGKPVLFAGSEDGTLYACSAKTGRPLWKFTSGHRIDAAPVLTRIAGQPIIVIVNAFGMMRALSARNGSPIWKYKCGHEILSTPAIVKTADKLLVVVGASDRCVHAVNAKTGEREWKFTTGKYVVASPAIGKIRGRATVFINSLDNNLYVLDASSGCEIMRFASGDMLWPYETRGISTWSSPSLGADRRGHPLLLYPGHDGKLYAFTTANPATANTGDAILTNWNPVESAPSPSPARRPAGMFSYLPPVLAGILLLAGFALLVLPAGIPTPR